MGDAILQGLIWGFGLSILIGPVFFYLLETSLSKGIKEALYVDLGVFLSDLACIFLAYFFVDIIQGYIEDNPYVKIIGGVIFIILGISSFYKKVCLKPAEEIEVPSGFTLAVDIVKGFMLNMVNPSVYLYWSGVMLFANSKLDHSGGSANLILFFVVLLTTFFTIDVLKILGANKLKKFVNEKMMRRLNMIIGVVFVVFGVLLVLKGFDLKLVIG